MKRVLKSQLLSMFYGGIAMLSLNLFIRFELEIAIIIIFGDIMFLAALTAFINYKLSYTKWLDIVLISFPFLVYVLFAFVVISQIIPNTMGANDYGVGLVLLFSIIGYCLSIVVGSIAAVVIRKIRVQGLSS